MEILRASEDYLESMLMMKLKHGYIRSIDVAEHLGVTKPSVTYATRRLKESGHITMDKDGLITLTACPPLSPPAYDIFVTGDIEVRQRPTENFFLHDNSFSVSF